MKKKSIGFFAAAIFVFVATAPHFAQAALITCGKSANSMCTLCDIILGFRTLILFMQRMALYAGLAMITIAGVMYAVSSGDKGLIDQAKNIISMTLKGIVIIFASWLIINTLVWVLGTKTGLGIGVQSWSSFNCNRTE